jgi:hypothetical protein
LAWRSLHDPDVKRFELALGILSELNAVCHACAGVG